MTPGFRGGLANRSSSGAAPRTRVDRTSEEWVLVDSRRTLIRGHCSIDLRRSLGGNVWICGSVISDRRPRRWHNSARCSFALDRATTSRNGRRGIHICDWRLQRCRCRVWRNCTATGCLLSTSRSFR